MAGIIIFDPRQSSWTASGSAFMNVIDAIAKELSLDRPAIEANMALHIATDDLISISTIIDYIDDTWRLSFIDNNAIEEITASYLIALADLKVLAQYNLCKRLGNSDSFNTGLVGIIQHQHCFWSAPHHIFNHLVERLVAGAKYIGDSRLASLLLSARVDSKSTLLDLTPIPFGKWLTFQQHAEALMSSYLNKKGLRFADSDLFDSVQPFAQSLNAFFSCLDTDHSVIYPSPTHSSSSV